MNRFIINNKIKYLMRIIFTVIFFTFSFCACDRETTYISSKDELLSDVILESEASEQSNYVSENQLKSNSSNEIYADSIYVHISGAVNNPGVYEMTSEARLFEAINKAGGFSKEASTDYCNLASIISDGEQYYIPTVEEARLLKNTDSASQPISHYDNDGRLNINLASREELMELSGIGQIRADAIISYRQEHGGFNAVEDLMEISGIKESLYSKISDDIYVQ